MKRIQKKRNKNKKEFKRKEIKERIENKRNLNNHTTIKREWVLRASAFLFHRARALTNAARRFARPLTSYWCKSQDCESIRRSESPQLKIIVPGLSRFREKGLWTRWLGYWRTSLGFNRVCKIRVISQAYCELVDSVIEERVWVLIGFAK